MSIIMNDKMNSIIIPKYINNIQIIIDSSIIVIIINDQIYYFGNIQHYPELKDLHNIIKQNNIKDIKFCRSVVVLFHNNNNNYNHNYLILRENRYNLNYINNLKLNLNKDEYVEDYLNDGYSYIYVLTNKKKLINLCNGNTIDNITNYWIGLFCILIEKEKQYYLIQNNTMISYIELNNYYNYIKKIVFSNQFITILLKDNSIFLLNLNNQKILLLDELNNLNLTLNNINGYYMSNMLSCETIDNNIYILAGTIENETYNTNNKCQTFSAKQTKVIIPSNINY